MNMNEAFVAERQAAVHCPELLSRPMEPSGGLASFAQFGKALGPRFAARLDTIFHAGEWEAKIGEPELTGADELAERIGEIAGNFVLPVGDAGGRLFASISLPPILDRLSRMFGGDAATLEGSIGKKLPRSVLLLLQRLEREITGAIGECLDEAAMREGDSARFAPVFADCGVFPARTQAIVMKLSFSGDGHPPLEILFACRKAVLQRLMAHFAGEGPVTRPLPEMLDPALHEIPLQLRARLAEMRLPVQRLLSLKPGQTLPLAVSRSVPLFIAGRKLATGTVGEQDDRIALQIDNVFIPGESA